MSTASAVLVERTVSEDAAVFEWAQSTNNGSSSTHWVTGSSSASWGSHAWLKFDISDLSGVSVDDATLQVYVSASEAVPLTLVALEAANGWSEGSITWSNQPSYGPVTSPESDLTTVGAWVDIDVTSYLQSEINASASDFSVVVDLGPSVSSGDMVELASLENSNSSLAPTLVVNHSGSSGGGGEPGGESGNVDLPVAGVNITWQNMSYFSTSAALTDAMKASSAWRDDPTFQVDEHGYPTSLQSGEVARRFIFFDTTSYPTGNYTLKWEGTGSIEIDTCNNSYSFGPSDAKTQTIPISDSTCAGGVELRITATQQGDHIHNVRFFLPGYDENSSYWTDHYINFHSQFGVTRVVWGSGLYSPQSAWSERSELEDISWSDSDTEPMRNNGLPYEAMIDLANRADVDLWICAPPRADQTFQQNLATMVRDNLDDDLRVWIEWGNEQWNCGYWGYEACDYLYELESQNGQPVPYNHADQALSLFNDFINVFSATNERDRLLTVLGGQSANSWQLQEAAAEIDSRDEMDKVDLFTIAGYFNGDQAAFDAYNQGGMTSAYPLLEDIIYDVTHGNGNLGTEIQENLDLAEQYNKPMVVYEGGHHITTYTSPPHPDYMAQDFSRDSRTYDFYVDYLNMWDDMRSTYTFVHYSDYAEATVNEAFGLLESYDQPYANSPKLQAFLAWQSDTQTNGWDGSGVSSGSGGSPGGRIADDDAGVHEWESGTNNGSDPTAWLIGPYGASWGSHGWLGFDISDLSGETVSSATLRVYVTDLPSGSRSLVALEGSSGWSEGTITWSNQPSYGPTIGSSVSVTSTGWVDLDVTSYLQSEINASASQFSVVVDQEVDPNGENLQIATKENGTSDREPRLMITLQ